MRCYRVPVNSESLSEAFWAVSHQLRHRTRVTLEPWHLSPSLARAMRVLAGHGTLRPGALAEHLRIAARSATEVVDDLERLGLVERRPDPADRRATLVALTPAGVETHDAIEAAREAEGERFFAALGSEDRDALLRLLRKLI
jgi:DNA-binding MarR family transcriptional regulator